MEDDDWVVPPPPPPVVKEPAWEYPPMKRYGVKQGESEASIALAWVMLISFVMLVFIGIGVFLFVAN